MILTIHNRLRSRRKQWSLARVEHPSWGVPAHSLLDIHPFRGGLTYGYLFEDVRVVLKHVGQKYSETRPRGLLPDSSCQQIDPSGCRSRDLAAASNTDSESSCSGVLASVSSFPRQAAPAGDDSDISNTSSQFVGHTSWTIAAELALRDKQSELCSAIRATTGCLRL